MAVVNYTMNPNEPLTKEQKEEIKRAKEMTDVYDEDCPPLTDEQLAELAAVARQQRAMRKRNVVSLRLPAQTLEKAKKLGEGYTSVLSRMIEFCLNDKEILQKCL